MNELMDFMIEKRFHVIFAYIGLILFILGSTIAIVFKSDYSITEQTFSKLGRGEYSYIFNLTVFLTGIFIMMFYSTSFYYFYKNEIKPFLSLMGIIVSIIAFISLSLVGIINLEISGELHRIVASLFFIFTTITQIIFTIVNPRVNILFVQFIVMLFVIYLLSYLIDLHPIAQKLLVYSYVFIGMYHSMKI